MPSPTLEQQRKKQETTRQLSYEVRAAKAPAITLTYDGDGASFDWNAAFFNMPQNERVDFLYHALCVIELEHEELYKAYRDAALACQGAFPKQENALGGKSTESKTCKEEC